MMNSKLIFHEREFFLGRKMFRWPSCGGLKENGPHRTGTVRRSGLVVRVGFEVCYAEATPSVTVPLLPMNQNMELSAPSLCTLP